MRSVPTSRLATHLENQKVYNRATAPMIGIIVRTLFIGIYQGKNRGREVPKVQGAKTRCRGAAEMGIMTNPEMGPSIMIYQVESGETSSRTPVS